MLDVMRKSADSPVLKILFVIIVLVFLFWGVGTVGQNQLEVAAEVNDQVITSREFQRSYERIAAMYQNMGAQSPPAELLRNQAMSQLIDLELLVQEAKRLGLEVDEAELRDAIAASPDFQQDGRFDKERYILLLQQNGYKPSDFEEQQRRRMVAGKVQEVVRSGVHVTDQEVLDQFRFENERLNLRFVRIPAADFRDKVTLADADVQQYYTDHQEEYREPERVRVKLVEFRPQDFAAQVSPTDAEVQTYYDSHLSDYQRKEEVRARHILFKVAPDASDADKAAARSKAEAVLAQAKGGGDFAELAKQNSQDVSAAEGGDLGLFGRGVMMPTFETAAFALEPGQISEIVETPFGFHIIKLEEKLPERTEPLEAVRTAIIDTMKTQQARTIALQKVEQAHEQMLNGTDIAQAAAGAGLNVQTPSPFGRNEPVAGLGVRPELSKAAFLAEPGEVGEIVSEPSGYTLFVVEELIPTTIPELTAVRTKVEDDLRGERATAAAKQRGEQLLTTLKGNPDLDALAQQENLKVEDSTQIGRAGAYMPSLGSSPELKEAAFRLTAAAPVAPAVYEVNGDAVLAVLKEKVPADESRLESEKKALRDRLQQMAESGALKRFIDELKTNAQIQFGRGFETGLPMPAAQS